MTLATRLLLRNLSGGRLALFVVCNVIGMLIVGLAVQFYSDARTIWTDEGSFMSSDYVVINKKVSNSSIYDSSQADFSEKEISDLESQPWVREIGRFQTARFRIGGSLTHGGTGMSTALFFESVPDRFLDVAGKGWGFRPGDSSIPVIIPKDYLTLYNFGFAASAGMPRLSEQLMEGIPLEIRMRGSDGVTVEMPGRVVGFTNRLNTILVPESFMNWANATFAPGSEGKSPTRLIIDTDSPGDTAIDRYLDEHGWEQAGGEGRNSAAFLLRTLSAVVGAVGLIITLMSLFILILSLSLLMEKNRDKIRSLILLGSPLREVARPYRLVSLCGGGIALLLAAIGIIALRLLYVDSLVSLGAAPVGVWPGIAVSALLAVGVFAVNSIVVGNRVGDSFDS